MTAPSAEVKARVERRRPAAGHRGVRPVSVAISLVITLSGTLDFQTREGKHFLIRPGDILFAEDTAGSGHSWRLTDDQPWRRAYVVLAPGAAVPFQPHK